MRKMILTAVMLIISIAASYAQFEQGKYYLGTSFEGVGLSYSEQTKTNLNLGVNGGYMFEQDLLAIGEVGFNYSNKDLQKLYLGAKVRYLIEQNGLFLQGGVRYEHGANEYNNLTLTPEVGYCFFLNGHLTMEPSIFYDMSLSDFSKKSRAGVKIGLGWYF